MPSKELQRWHKLTRKLDQVINQGNQGGVLTGEQLSESGIKKEGSDKAEPSWKDRSGRLPGTALSLTSPRESLGNLPKRRTPFLGWARILRRKVFCS